MDRLHLAIDTNFNEGVLVVVSIRRVCRYLGKAELQASQVGLSTVEAMQIIHDLADECTYRRERNLNIVKFTKVLVPTKAG